MFEEQHPRNESLISINSPDGSRNGVADDLACRSLGDLKEEDDYLRTWIDYAIGRRSCIPWGTESLPPQKILEHPDVLEKYWGFERLIAYDICCDVEICHYKSYLEKFYALNDDCQSKADDLIREFLEKEKALTPELEARNITYDYYDECFLEYLSGLLNNPEKKRHPFIAYTAAYLVKEAELLIEWTKRGHDITSLQFKLISEIQGAIVDFAMLKGAFRSKHAAAVLLGMTKEVAQWLRDAYKDCFVPTKASIYILGYASDFLTHQLCEFKYEDAEEVSDDVASTVEVKGA